MQFASRPGPTKNKLERENAYLLELAIRILERAGIGAYEIVREYTIWYHGMSQIDI